MKRNLPQDNKMLFDLAAKALKYFLLALLGFAIASILSKAFGVALIAGMLLSPSIWQWILRLAVFIFCMFAIAMIIESWR
jgi:hypothetical protein